MGGNTATKNGGLSDETLKRKEERESRGEIIERERNERKTKRTEQKKIKRRSESGGIRPFRNACRATRPSRNHRDGPVMSALECIPKGPVGKK